MGWSPSRSCEPELSSVDATVLSVVADYVQRADVREMMNEVEDFARRRPAVFIGSAFAVGLLAARFLKSSREGEERSRDRASDRLTDREVPSTVVMEPRPGSDLESWPETI